jgi:hypothetical protein
MRVNARQAAARRYESLFAPEPQASRSRSVDRIESEDALDLKAEVVTSQSKPIAGKSSTRTAWARSRSNSIFQNCPRPSFSSSPKLLAEGRCWYAVLRTG